MLISRKIFGGSSGSDRSILREPIEFLLKNAIAETAPKAVPATHSITPKTIAGMFFSLFSTLSNAAVMSSLRISEIQALRWENIPENPKFIRVSGAVVFNEHNEYARKAANKNISSSRDVPILIPELRGALERDRKPRGPVLSVTQNSFREYLRRLNPQIGITTVSPHGLRHTFASLAYSLQIPERITMEIGGWSNPATMHKIYTHISKADISRYEGALSDFFNNC